MSDNTTPEPERILLHADFSTTRHEQPDSDDVVEHERQRREKLSRERMLLLADLTADFRDDPFNDDGAGPVRPDEEAAT